MTLEEEPQITTYNTDRVDNPKLVTQDFDSNKPDGIDTFQLPFEIPPPAELFAEKQGYPTMQIPAIAATIYSAQKVDAGAVTAPALPDQLPAPREAQANKPTLVIQFLSNPNERAIVDRARTGDTEAVGAIFDLYVNRIYAYALANTNNIATAEDITGDVFLAVVEYIERFEWQKETAFSAWIYRITKNRVISHFRKQALRGNDVSLDKPNTSHLASTDTSQDPAVIVADWFDIETILQASKYLPPNQKLVFDLRLGSGLNVRETAIATRKTENNVKVLLHKAVTTVRRILQDSGYAEQTINAEPRNDHIKEIVHRVTYDKLTTSEVGKILGISTSTVLSLIARGRLKASLVPSNRNHNGKYQITKQDLLDFAQSLQQ